MKKSRENNQFYVEGGIDLEGRRITIDEDIDEYTAGWAIRAIHKMEENSNEPIDIYINSYGGSVYDGLALYNLLRRTNCLIRTHAMGKIMSMAFLIYLAGDERYAERYATFLNHSISSVAWGKLHEMVTEIKECQRLEQISLEILENRTFKDMKWWKKQTRYEDKYYDVVQAMELGIIINSYNCVEKDG